MTDLPDEDTIRSRRAGSVGPLPETEPVDGQRSAAGGL